MAHHQAEVEQVGAQIRRELQKGIAYTKYLAFHFLSLGYEVEGLHSIIDFRNVCKVIVA